LWAEDGLFFAQARESGFRSIAKPMNGSYYLYQRVVAYAGNSIKPAYVPIYYNYTALLTTLAVLAYVMRCRTDCQAKWLFALAIVVSPHSGEVFLNLTNVHWIMALALLTLIFSEDAQTTTGRRLECCLLVLLCLTGPFGLLFWPLFVSRWLRRKSLYSVLFLGIASACAVMQLHVLHADRLPGHFHIGNPGWISFFGNRLAGLWFVGDTEVVNTYPDSRFFLGLSCAFLLLLTSLAIWYKDADCLGMLAAVAAIVLSTAYAYRGDPEFYCRAAGFGDRYGFVSTVIVVWIVLRLMHRSDRLFFPGCFLLALFAMSSASFPACRPLPDLHWNEASRAIDGPLPCEAPINPLGWKVRYIPKHH
jgi:hypothetical protein